MLKDKINEKFNIYYDPKIPDYIYNIDEKELINNIMKNIQKDGADVSDIYNDLHEINVPNLSIYNLKVNNINFIKNKGLPDEEIITLNKDNYNKL